MEQLCFSVGSCLLEPCLSLRPKPDVAQLETARVDCSHVEATPEALDLVCAFADVKGGKDLYYESFRPELGVFNCWQALERMGPEPYRNLRVWEQIGWSSSPQHTIDEYQRYAKALIFEARANQLL